MKHVKLSEVQLPNFVDEYCDVRYIWEYIQLSDLP